MTDIDLDAIRTRADGTVSERLRAREDVHALIAEVERLRTAVAGIEEALIQAAFMQIALDQCLTVLPVGEWGSTTRAHVPGHWREAATRRAQPYILTVAEVIARADA